MKRLYGYLGLAAFALIFAGCSGASQTQQQCLAIETVACAGQHDPMMDRPGFGACVAQEAQLCGVVPTPSPSPTPAPVAK